MLALLLLHSIKNTHCGVAQLVECLPGVHKALGSIPRTAETRVVPHTYNLCTQVVDARRWEVRGHAQLHRELQASWDTRDSNSNTQKQDRWKDLFIWALDFMCLGFQLSCGLTIAGLLVRKNIMLQSALHGQATHLTVIKKQ